MTPDAIATEIAALLKAIDQDLSPTEMIIVLKSAAFIIETKIETEAEHMSMLMELNGVEYEDED